MGTNVEAGKVCYFWYIRMKVRRDRNASGYNEVSFGLQDDEGPPDSKNGLYNIVSGPYDHDGVSNNVRAPVRPRTIRAEKVNPAHRSEE